MLKAYIKRKDSTFHYVVLSNINLVDKIVYLVAVLNFKSCRRSFKEKRQTRSVAGCRVQCSRDAVQGGRSRVRCRLRLHAPGPPHALPSSPHVSPPTDLTCFDVRCPPTTMQNLCPLTTVMGRWEIFNLCPYCDYADIDRLRIRLLACIQSSVISI